MLLDYTPKESDIKVEGHGVCYKRRLWISSVSIDGCHLINLLPRLRLFVC
jgi:hypothetical protein